MNVGELQDYLSQYPKDMEIVMSRDSEGNGYSPLYTAGECMYRAETTWMGEIYATPEEIAEEGSQYTEEDEAPSDAKRVIGLWPVN